MKQLILRKIDHVKHVREKYSSTAFCKGLRNQCNQFRQRNSCFRTRSNDNERID